MKQNSRIAALAGVSLLALYVGSYVSLYANKSPAGNLRYFVYSKGGVETEGHEHTLYRLFYPIYKTHKWLGAAEHNDDRPELAFPKGFNG